MLQFDTETNGPVLQYQMLEGLPGARGVQMGLLRRSLWEKEGFKWGCLKGLPGVAWKVSFGEGGFKWGCLQGDSLSVLHKHRQLERHLAFEIVQIASFIT